MLKMKRCFLKPLLLGAFSLLALPALIRVQAAPEPMQAQDTNLLGNASFEDGKVNWKIADGSAQVVSDVAHSGAFSLYYQNTDPNQYKMFSQGVKVQPGQRLTFSVWVKGRNITSNDKSQGAGLYMESYDASGKYIGGAFPRTFNGSFDWTPAQGEYIVPPNAATTSVGLYLRRGVTGEVWFDDVSVLVKTAAPFVSFLQYPNYRGLVKQGDTTPWRFHLRATAPQEQASSPLQMNHSLVDANGTVLFQERRELPLTEKGASVEIPSPPNLMPGSYTLRQTIQRADGSIALESRHPVQIVRRMPKVYIDAQGFTVVDGKRFFPLGLFLGPTEDEHLQRIARGGFNTVLSYGYGSDKEPEAYLDRADKNNLKVVYSLKDMYQGLPNATHDAREKAAGYMKQLRHHPALLSWYINDEMATEWLPALQRMYDQAKLLDPDHPAYQVLFQMNILEQYYGVTDILGTDPYPVGQADLTKTSADTRATIAATHGAKGVWMVPQVFDWAVYHADKPPRAPSRDEMRNQAYQAIINGATGLIFYSYFDLFYEKHPRSAATRDEALFQRRWADVALMGREINQLLPVILQNNKVPLERHTQTRVAAAAWEYRNQLLILLANPYYQVEKMTFTLPAGWKIANAEQAGIQSRLQGRQVTFSLPSMSSGVFRLVKE